jgi:hypothetical protein
VRYAQEDAIKDKIIPVLQLFSREYGPIVIAPSEGADALRIQRQESICCTFNYTRIPPAPRFSSG